MEGTICPLVDPEEQTGGIDDEGVAELPGPTELV